MKKVKATLKLKGDNFKKLQTYCEYLNKGKTKRAEKIYASNIIDNMIETFLNNITI